METLGTILKSRSTVTYHPIIEENWATYSGTEKRRSGIIVKRNNKTMIIKPAVFHKGKVYTTVSFEKSIKVRIKKNNIKEYPFNSRPVF